MTFELSAESCSGECPVCGIAASSSKVLSSNRSKRGTRVTNSEVSAPPARVLISAIASRSFSTVAPCNAATAALDSAVWPPALSAERKATLIMAASFLAPWWWGKVPSSTSRKATTSIALRVSSSSAPVCLINRSRTSRNKRHTNCTACRSTRRFSGGFSAGLAAAALGRAGSAGGSPGSCWGAAGTITGDPRSSSFASAAPAAPNI
mmetsp:Transcript_23494/g.60323  ORF Transcript_23494/g.60323 Transcript_23494/m.60323 type:complete len:207 (+) Transcript_23494:681-1301(+)